MGFNGAGRKRTAPYKSRTLARSGRVKGNETERRAGGDGQKRQLKLICFMCFIHPSIISAWLACAPSLAGKDGFLCSSHKSRRQMEIERKRRERLLSFQPASVWSFAINAYKSYIKTSPPPPLSSIILMRKKALAHLFLLFSFFLPPQN